jgi:hypothetical protein
MRVLVACEFSGIVRDAFIAHGHHAVSCDLLPSERAGPHIEDDVLRYLGDGWDLMIAFPPCTYLARSGGRWWAEHRAEQQAAVQFVAALLGAPIARIAIENPIGALSKAIRPPDQIVQPWEFGHPETKATCFWLKGLRPLVATHWDGPSLFAAIAPAERAPRVHWMSPSPERSKNRSRTCLGIASAMAEQWGVSTREEHK